MKPSIRIVWASLLIVFLLLALVCLAAVSLPYALLRAGADLLARDGSLDIFTPAVLVIMRPFLEVAGTILGLVFMVCLAFRARSMGILVKMAAWGRDEFAQFSTDGEKIRQSLAGIHLSWLEWSALVLIILAGLYNRLVLLRAPMQYDEAYTFMGFARHSFWYVLTNYELPNNHVFHTLLVKFSSLIFGISPAAIRLPAFAAGVLVIPASFWVGWKLYRSIGVGLAAAAVTAYWPVVTAYSANARGYSLLMLFSLCLVGLGSYLVRNKNRMGWLAFVLIAVLGLYTVPVMIYPLSGVMLWMLVSVLWGEGRKDYTLSHFIKHFIFAGISMLVLTVILYLPILVYSGWRSLVANPYVTAYAYPAFFAHLPAWGMAFWVSWTDSSRVIVDLVIVGFFLEWFFARKQTGHRFSFTLVMLVWLIPVFLIQHPELNPKIVVSLVPLILLSAAGGWHALLQRVRLPGWAPRLLLVGVICLSFFGIYQRASINLSYLLGRKSQMEQATDYIAAQYQADDMILTTFPVGAQVWYYCYQAGIPADRMVDYRGKPFKRAWLVVDQPEQTLEDIIQMAEGENILIYRAKLGFPTAQFGPVSVYLYQP